jgi:hypothetical protein
MAILRRYPRRGLAGPLAILLLLVAGGVRLAHAFTIDGTVGATFTMNDRRTVGINTKAIYIQNNSASNPQTFGAAASNAWATLLNSTGTITLPAGAWFIAATPDATGWAVTAATGDLLKAAGTGTDQFTLVLIGSDT